MLETLSCTDNVEIRVFDVNGNAKQIWNENAIGRSIRKHAGRELRITGFTGHYDSVMRTHNLITNVGHAQAAGLLSNQGSFSPAKYLAIGTSATAAAVTDTTLGAEITNSGLARASATASLVTTSVSNDTVSLVFTFGPATAAAAVTEQGIFDAASAGHMTAHAVYSVINMAIGDSMQVTHKVQC